MKKILMILLVTVLVFNYIKTEDVIIPANAIRFRVIASSDKKEDQDTKLLVRDNIEKKIMSDIEDIKDLETTRKTLINNTANYKTFIEKILDDNNINTSVSVNYGLNYFPEKEYKGVKYEEGDYESLVITLGNGIGKNWWCVLFPPLCLLEAEETEAKEEVEYKFFVKELIDSFFK